MQLVTIIALGVSKRNGNDMTKYANSSKSDNILLSFHAPSREKRRQRQRIKSEVEFSGLGRALGLGEGVAK